MRAFALVPISATRKPRNNVKDNHKSLKSGKENWNGCSTPRMEE